MLMPQLAARLQTQDTAMRVHLVDLVPDSHIDTLERYEVDIALIPRTPLPDCIQSRTVFRSGFLMIVRRDHPRLASVALGGVMPLDLFCDLDHVLFSPEGNSTGMGDVALAQVGRTRNVV